MVLAGLRVAPAAHELRERTWLHLPVARLAFIAPLVPKVVRLCGAELKEPRPVPTVAALERRRHPPLGPSVVAVVPRLVLAPFLPDVPSAPMRRRV